MADEHAHDHSGHDHSDHAGHSHGHGHSHAPKDFGLAFAIGVSLNMGFVIVEAVYGFLSNSMALLADAGHNFSDVLGLLIAWVATILAKRKPGGRYSYGLRSSSIVAALINALFLVVAISIIAFEAVGRFSEPAPVAGKTVIIVAAIGIAINTATALMFMRGSKGDINIRGAFLHMAADAAVSAGVVVAGFVILATGWSWIDPAVSLVIVAVIAVGTWGLLRDSVNMSLHAIPPGVDQDEVAEFIKGQPGVAAIHDLHIWSMSTTETALTVHLVVPAGYPGDAFSADLARELKSRFSIDHPTIQIETSAAENCALEPDDVV
ncbi:cation diffusion facilitator family transporter [Novosphingobium olei]|jgi:cobalt-zinc-cadmium efflux system protein|uniref:Cation transporter n=1 Tax=Novosphingobium olei TaxID=2728851 RepID=A0A7Y0G9S6_9SPHN|nr:cation diffusion facilitator family transporter [Novosphingobium olei]NML94310.1 cation transporter [Novosphingobium olei]